MWNEFNIKPIRAETIVYRDGVFLPDVSTIENGPINRKYGLPVHVIYVGEITGENALNIEINIENQPVFLSVNITNKTPTIFNIFVKNTGKKSDFRAHVMLNNSGELNYQCTAHHTAPETTILFQTKLIANRDSKSKIAGTAIIDKNCDDCMSDIGFTAMADRSAKISFLPAQRILSVPQRADHGAAIYRPTDAQVLYLRESGLSGAEVDDTMKVAFMNDFDLF